MDWGLIGTVLTVVFGIVAVISIIVAFRLTRRKKPTWAFTTTQVIGLGSNAPKELKLTFDGKPIDAAYQTTFIFFNRGNEAIRQDDLAKPINICFRDAEILRLPDVARYSKKEIEFTASQVVTDAQNAVRLGFLYLGHNDGAVIEVIHTKAKEVHCLGDVIDAQIEIAKEFDPMRKRPSTVVPIIAWSPVAVYVLSIPIRLLFGLNLGDNEPLFVSLALFLSAILLSNIREQIQYRRFPGWST